MSEQPTEEELRAYMDQLRSAPVEEVVAQAFSMLAAAAEAKLGEPDARVLIDGIAGLTQATAGKLSQLGTQMSQGVSQLQAAQVQLEGRREQPDGGDAESGGQTAGADERTAGQAAGSDASGQPSQPQQPEERMTDRLWVPGRGEPRPPTR